ncbi:hypothetical protein [Pantoea cypripedii]|uniref:E3 ubiquitin-protein ligase SopA-like catalytic domain-containing protein n=1 Tax=Pantoea cypripedii TaxID=55209 RepID=A0A1X1EY02_PANCY|nr:hypothetical protein [Pantoea cypripedii]MBP2194986.1 hypothetical protein [Pantoea cypripedii]ORM94831.1 hypothetical protein HA50_16370 [Pantoea cypripedii]
MSDMTIGTPVVNATAGQTDNAVPATPIRVTNSTETLLSNATTEKSVFANEVFHGQVLPGINNSVLIDADFSGNIFTDVAFLGERGKPLEIRGCNFNGIKANNIEMAYVKFTEGTSFINVGGIESLYFSGPANLREARFGSYEEGAIKLSRQHFSDLQKTFDNLCDDNYSCEPAMLFKSIESIINTTLHRDFKQQIVALFRDMPELDYALAHSDALRQSMLAHLLKTPEKSEVITGFLEDKLIKYHAHSLIKNDEKTNLALVLSKMEPEKLLEHQFLVNQLPDVRQTMNKYPTLKAFMECARKFDKSPKEGVIFYFPQSEQAIYIFAHEFDNLIAGETAPENARLLTCDNGGVMITPLTDKKRQTLLQNTPALESLWSGRGRKLAEVLSPLFGVPAHMEARRNDLLRLGSLVLAQLTKDAHGKLNLDDIGNVYLLKQLFTPLMNDITDESGDARNKRAELIEQVCHHLNLASSGLVPQQQKFAAAILLTRVFANLFSPTFCSTDSASHSWFLDFAKQFLIDAYDYAPNATLADGVDTVISHINENRTVAALLLINSLQFISDNDAVIAGLIHQHIPVF